MFTTIYLIRHGEVHNPKGTLYGRLPGFGLSERGRTEIKQTAAFLKNKHIDIIYSSPLLRAKQTAALIRLETSVQKLLVSKSILEVKTSFQGQPFAALSPDQSEVYFSSKRHASDETIKTVAKRMDSFVKKLAKKHSGKQIVVVGHGDPLMLLKAKVTGLPLEFDSIRKGEKFEYIRHGEVFQLDIAEDGRETIKSIFKPDSR